MKPFFSIYTYSLLFLVLIASSCIDDNSIQETDLLGEWEIVSAFRKGKATESMTGLYFQFLADGQLVTNMTGIAETYQYIIEGQNILQRNGSLDVDYAVDLLTEDSLILLTVLRSKEFRMILSRDK